MRLATIVLIATSLLGLTQTAAAGPLAPIGLRVEHLVNPIGIDVLKPRFSWELRHTDRGQAQTAYQITITKDGAKEGSAAFWDSGRVASPQSSLVEYGGPGEP